MEKLVILGKILSDINRVKILALLQRDKELCVCEICDTLELSQPLVSRHLKQIREAKLVTSNQTGKWIIYRLVEEKRLSFLLTTIDVEILNLPKLISCTKLS